MGQPPGLQGGVEAMTADSEALALERFMTARLDEAEAAARACPHEDWEVVGPDGGVYLCGDEGHDRLGAGSWAHLAQGISMHDPRHLSLAHAALHDPHAALRSI